MLGKPLESPGDVSAKLNRGFGYLIDELVASIDQDHDVSETSASVEVILSPGAEGLKLRSQEVWRRGNHLDHLAGGQRTSRINKPGALGRDEALVVAEAMSSLCPAA